VSYRNDFAAAFARAEALERELGAARDKATRDDARIALLERELAELRRQLADRAPSPPAASSTATPPVAPRAATQASSEPAPREWLLALILIVSVIGFALSYCALRTSTPEPAEGEVVECTLRTDPPGAIIYVVERTAFVPGVPPRAADTTLGMTPLAKSRAAWNALSAMRLEARLPGYVTREVSVPTRVDRCDERVYPLAPQP